MELHIGFPLQTVGTNPLCRAVVLRTSAELKDHQLKGGMTGRLSEGSGAYMIASNIDFGKKFFEYIPIFYETDLTFQTPTGIQTTGRSDGLAALMAWLSNNFPGTYPDNDDLPIIFMSAAIDFVDSDRGFRGVKIKRVAEKQGESEERQLLTKWKVVREASADRPAVLILHKDDYCFLKKLLPEKGYVEKQISDLNNIQKDTMTSPWIIPLEKEGIPCLCETFGIDRRKIEPELVWNAPPLSFEELIANKTESFVGREWLFEKVGKWFNDPDGKKIISIEGGPGIGKTSIAAMITKKFPVVANYFCQRENQNTDYEVEIIKSIVHQLSMWKKEYADIVLRKNADIIFEKEKNNLNYLWKEFVSDPLNAVDHRDGNKLIVISGIDRKGDLNSGLLSFFSTFDKLPKWIKIIVTGENIENPETSDITERFLLSSHEESLRRDIYSFFEKNTIKPEKNILDKIQTNFLVASLTTENIKHGMDRDEAFSCATFDIFEYYTNWIGYLSDEANLLFYTLFRKVFEVLTSVREEVSWEFVCFVVELHPEIKYITKKTLLKHFYPLLTIFSTDSNEKIRFCDVSFKIWLLSDNAKKWKICKNNGDTLICRKFKNLQEVQNIEIKEYFVLNAQYHFFSNGNLGKYHENKSDVMLKKYYKNEFEKLDKTDDPSWKGFVCLQHSFFHDEDNIKIELIKSAILYYNEAISHNSKSWDFLSRGYAIKCMVDLILDEKIKKQLYSQGMEDYNTAIILSEKEEIDDEVITRALYLARGFFLLEFADFISNIEQKIILYGSAIKDYDKVIKMHDTDAFYYERRAVAKNKLAEFTDNELEKRTLLEEALSDLLKAEELERNKFKLSEQ